MMLKLPRRMEEVLLAVYGGRRGSNVARGLGMTRQAVSKLVKEGRARLAEVSLEVAEILDADVVKVDLSKGYAILTLSLGS